MFRIFSRPFKTLRGESVYSSGEKSIADFLFNSKIPYKYETPLRLGWKKYKPDFFLPDCSIFIEYLGMIEDPEYAYKTQFKKITYRKHNLDVIYIIPQHLRYLGTIINQWIQYKKGNIQQTEYIRLSREYVPKPLSREWVKSRKRKIHPLPRFSLQAIKNSILHAAHN